MNALRFGTAGIPVCAKGTSTTDGLFAVRKLGLKAMELEFVQGVNLTEESARKIARGAKDLDVVLTVHAPYYLI
jgi:deoxyribonuclease-4